MHEYIDKLFKENEYLNKLQNVSSSDEYIKILTEFKNNLINEIIIGIKTKQTCLNFNDYYDDYYDNDNSHFGFF